MEDPISNLDNPYSIFHQVFHLITLYYLSCVMSRRSARESKKVVYEDFVDYDEFEEKPARGRRKSTGRKAAKAAGWKC